MNNDILREITPLSVKDCFYIVDRRKKAFTYPIHCHKEFELNLVIHAPGVMRVVGDSSEIIGDYDLVLITSPGLEHAWEQGDCKSELIREITIQFSPNFLKNLIETNQFARIHKMFDKARNGLCFSLDAIMGVYAKIDKLSESKGFYAVINFLSLLNDLSFYADDAKELSSSSYAKVENHSDSRRVLKVQEFVNNHYKEDIHLSSLADLVCMTEVSFSRFFKLRTGRNFTDYLIDIRLGYASRLLVDSTMSIAEICYDCGFNNLSNFNRIFKKKKNCTPKEFRDNYHKNRVII